MTFSLLFLKIQLGVIPTIPATEDLINSALQKVYVGMSKDNFSVVEKSHSVIGVCRIFGSYIKFVVTVSDVMIVEPVPKEVSEVIVGGLPIPLREKNRKDQMFNEILKTFLAMGLSWNDPELYGKPFIQDLCNLLWYIDGHHDVLASRSCQIPVFFSRFVGFNKPELSKHRKRSISNLSQEKIDEFSTIFQDYVMCSWMQQDLWAPLKQDLLKLVESLASYSAYLTMKNQSMKRHHASPEPSNFEDSCCLKYVTPAAEAVPSLLIAINHDLQNSSYYQALSLSDYTPKENRKRYLFIRQLEQGLSVPFFLLTYSHGSNVGNYYFCWKVPTLFHEEACSNENTRIINEIKKQIPVYHTRAMRQRFCDMFGRISPESKPHILRNIYNTLTNNNTASRTTAEVVIDARVYKKLYWLRIVRLL
jgi:hypothetical protein